MAACIRPPRGDEAVLAGGRVVEEEFLRQTVAVKAVVDLLESGAAFDVMHRQTAIQLGSGTDSLRPIYHHVSFSLAALDARVGGHGATGSDPTLLRHLGVHLDQKMLDALRRHLHAGGPLDVAPHHAATYPPVPVHVHLTLDALRSDAFGGFLLAAGRVGAPLSVEVSAIEAAADAPGFVAVRDALAGAGVPLVLGGINHLTLQLARPWVLRPSLLKLDWSPRLPDLDRAAAGRLERVLADIGPAAVILARAETEAALHWGMTRGIRKFQGRHVDAMLAASRLVACRHASRCTLRQCLERAAAIAPAGRAGCLDTALLDAGAPARLPVPARHGPGAALASASAA